MSSFRPSVVKTLVRHDLYYSLKSARGLLFLVFFAVFWFWVLWKLSSGNAKMLASADAGMVLSFIIDPKIISALFTNHAPTFSAFFYLAISTVPLFVLFASSDQTANDIGSKFLRFLTPRCNRIEIFIGRFLGAVILIAFAYTVISLIAALISIMVDKDSLSMVLSDIPLVVLSLIIYTIPFIALMSMCSTIVGSAGLSALVGISVYVTVLLIVSIIGIKMQGVADVVSYLIPNTTKPMLLQISWQSLLQAMLITPVYVFAYGFLGWLVFSKRDI